MDSDELDDVPLSRLVAQAPAVETRMVVGDGVGAGPVAVGRRTSSAAKTGQRLITSFFLARG